MKRPNIFVIGYSKTGKTPLAQSLAEQLGYQALSASEWIKPHFLPSAAAQQDVATYVQEITTFSGERLARDPNGCIDFLRHRYPVEAGGLVIDGIRNPRDFAHLFKPERDIVVFLWFARNPLKPTEFERKGIASIRLQIETMVEMGMMPRARWLEFRFNSLRARGEGRPDNIPGPPEAQPHWNLDDIKTVLGHRIGELSQAATSDTPATKGDVHIEIAPIRVWVENRLMFNDDPAIQGWTTGSIFEISSYPGRTPTFTVRLDNGSVFSFVPPHRLRHADPEHAINLSFDFWPLELNELAYHNCPHEKLAITRYQELARHECRAYFKTRKRPMPAVYLATLDWWTGNDLLHLIALQNGQFAFLPNHKILFGGDATDLPPYKKLRADWRVES